jgi:hypothetical protein
MTSKRGDVALLQDPVAQSLLNSRQPARLAYVWTDGSPRVVPIWFHWDGQAVVMAGPVDAPKVKALQRDARVSITIDDASSWPYRALLLRGRAAVDEVEGVAPEYAEAAQRYFGDEQASAWLQQVAQLAPRMMRVRVQPEWASILDFEQRFPSALERAMTAMAR